MQIDRSNYEIWIIDWLDGNLDNNQVRQLREFLDENPDIRDEFEDTETINIKPFSNSYNNKSLLKKSVEDLPLSQFEYLCVGDLENDINEDQRAELLETIEKDPEKKLSYDLIHKTKLVPELTSYKHKNHLLKRSTTRKVIRMSVTVLSAAATVALLFTLYFLLPKSPAEKTESTAFNVDSDTIFIQQPPRTVSVELETGKILAVLEQDKEKPTETSPEITAIIMQPESQTKLLIDSMAISTIIRERAFNKIPIHSEIKLNERSVNNTLIASGISPVIIPVDDGRSNISRFIAKTFREKILKEKVSKDTPLKGYEIAEAGVTGLNKLLGWEMALDEKNDQNGELKSVYFSSKILKFNAPVKKSEPLQ